MLPAVMSERNVCYAARYRNKIGLDVCAEIIRTYLRKEERDLSLLTDYAKRLRVWATLKYYLDCHRPAGHTIP